MNIKVRRSKKVLLAFIGGYGFMLLLDILHLTGVIHIDGASSWVIQGLFFAFILPALSYFCYLWSKREIPLLEISDEGLVLRTSPFLNHSLQISRLSIENIKTNWQGPNTDSPSDLVFILHKDFSQAAKNSSVLKLKKDGWHFDLSCADITPFDAVKLIKKHYAI